MNEKHPPSPREGVRTDPGSDKPTASSAGPDPGTNMRADKLVSAALGISRKDAKAMIRAGRVTRNGAALRNPDEKVSAAELAADGAPLRYERYVYLMLNKPKGVLSASRDPSQPTVTDLAPEIYRRRGLFPVGRLDKDTRGLLLLTDDGDFAHRVISPKSDVPKIYVAELARSPAPDAAQRFAEGPVLADGTRCLPAKLEAEGPLRYRVTVREGKYHQVRRMFAAVGSHVTELRRVRIGNLELDPDLPEGACRPLTEAERRAVFE